MTKKEILNAINELPEDITFDEAICHLLLIRNINAGLPATDLKKSIVQINTNK